MTPNTIPSLQGIKLPDLFTQANADLLAMANGEQIPAAAMPPLPACDSCISIHTLD
jgi:hypothetical protein